MDELEWSEDEWNQGKLIKIKEFPGGFKVKLFRVAVSSGRTDWIVTNDLSCPSAQDAQKVSASYRESWKAEEFHREAKQIAGIEGCQSRKGLADTRLQRHLHRILAEIYRPVMPASPEESPGVLEASPCDDP